MSARFGRYPSVPRSAAEEERGADSPALGSAGKGPTFRQRLGCSFGMAALSTAPAFLVCSVLSTVVLRSRGLYVFAALTQQGYRLVAGSAIIALAFYGFSGLFCSLMLAISAALFGTWSCSLSLAG